MNDKIRTNAPEPPQLVVGVGASAGGLEAFKQLLAALPGDTGMAFLLVQHLDPSHRSLLPELLAAVTPMRVTEADQDLRLQPDTVYVIRPDTALAVHRGRIALSAPSLHRGVRLPVDHLFRSLAREYGPRAVGIVLSGAGSDGSAGLREIKGAGGLTIAQDPDGTQQTGMPQSAIDTGLVDLVLRIEAIPEALARFASLPPGAARIEPASEDAAEVSRLSEHLTHFDEQAFGRIAAVLEAQVGFDLRVYKPATVERRVLRRMTLSGFDDLGGYLAALRDDPGEQRTLVRDLLISVTDFFRDPEAFRALREMVIDPLVSTTNAGETLRAWVPGCATGEEGYSIAMELLDAIGAQGKRLSVQVFATDVDQDALAIARAGIYPPQIAEHMSEQRLRTYFKPLDGRGYEVRGPLRDAVSFAVHDLAKDPPFSRMSLVSCRNVLIYLTAEVQAHVLHVLHFALEPEGRLFLSTSESTGAHSELFSTLSKTQRIYKKIGASRPIALARSRNRPNQGREEGGSDTTATQAGSPPPRARGQDLARRAVLEAWVPPTVVVAEDGGLLFMHGELGPFLRFPQGENPRLELGTLLRPEIATRTRGALYKCRRNQEPVTAVSSPDTQPGLRVRITAKPAPMLGDGAVMLTFEALADGAAEPAERPETPEQEAVIEQLERELQATREDLRNTVEELETSNEELRSSNEESMSMNEELQSANEELEATTEELRSLNEELTTVNSQLREKVEQLERAHDDLNNFFASTKVATVFLDEQLRVKRFTPAARELLGIDHTDIGRRIADIARELLQHGLEAESRGVLEHLSAQVRELQTRDGRWMTRQVLPYRTESRRIEGVVVTFADITALRDANQALDVKSRRLELAWEAARGGIYEHRVPFDEGTYHSDQWAQVLGYRREELPPWDGFESWLTEQIHPHDRERLERDYQAFITGAAQRLQVEARLRHRAGHWVWVRAIAKALEYDSEGRVRHVLGMMIDITDLKEVEEALRETETRFREMADGLPLIVWVHDAAGQLEYVNATYCEFFGVNREEMSGGRWQVLLHPDDADVYNREFFACVHEQRPFHGEARVRDAGGNWRWIESWARPRWSADAHFRGFIGTSADTTERREIEGALSESEERFRTLADNIAQLAWMADGAGSIFWYNKRWHDYTGTTFEELQGWGWRCVHHPEHIERVVAKLRDCFEKGQPWEDTFPLRGADGTYRWFLSQALPIRDDSGAVVRWFGTNTDITEQRTAEERLRESDRQKDEFLAMLGHELRNPLAAICTATDLLKVSGAQDPTTVRARNVLERQTGHMAKLLDGLLDVSRIIRGKIRLETKTVDLADICRTVLGEVETRLDGRTLRIRRDLPPEPVWVEADLVRVTQIVDNLVTNAAKFTPDGGRIELALGRRDGMAVLEVQDTGCGIEPELLPHVFETFRQTSQSLDRAHGGLGLGLSLVKSLVELHGGEVTAQSEGKDQGATFSVRLPLTEAPPPPAPEARPRGEGPLRILLIEDNQDAAEVLGQLLRALDYTVEIAHDGPQGIRLAKDWRPDLILCDLGLPQGMSGFDVARSLRGEAQTHEVPIVAVTGYGRAEDQDESRRAGFDAHLTKPIGLDAIRRVLTDLGLNRAGEGAQRTPGT